MSGCEKAPNKSASVAQPVTVEALDAEFSRFAAKKGFSGTVLIARDGEIILHKTYGPLSSDADKTEPAYWIASNSKQFMGAAIATLASEGKIDLDAPIETYLHNVPNDKQNITIRQLLTHTSGLDHVYATDGVVDRDEAVKTILGINLIHEPGEAFAYSNDGYNLLAIIAEIATGETYEEIMRSRVFAPIGLEHTGLWGFEADNASIAPIKNMRRAEALGETIYADGRSRPNWGFRGATGIYSTTLDLYRWVVRLMAAHSDEDDPLAMVTAPQQLIRRNEVNDVYYGFGIGVIYRDGMLYMISHSGDESELGHNSNIQAYADGGVIIVLSNSGYIRDSGWSTKIAKEARALLGK